MLKGLGEIEERLRIHLVSRRRSGLHYQQRPRDVTALFELDRERP
jgi:hypothetical protein